MHRRSPAFTAAACGGGGAAGDEIRERIAGLMREGGDADGNQTNRIGNISEAV